MAGAARARFVRDPALAVTVAALWVLLALFVIYPLLMLAGTAFVDEGRPALHPLLSVLQKPGTQRAFANSLLLGSLVGIIGTAAEGIALLKGAKNAAAGKKLIDWATSPAMQSLYAKHKINFVPAHPEAKTEESLAAILKDAKIFAIDDAYAGANRKRIVDRWVAEILP